MLSRSSTLLIMLSAACLMMNACALFPCPATRARGRFTLIAANGTAGALEPQGCACRRLGGMARRAGLIAAERAVGLPVLVLDSGNLLFEADTRPNPKDLHSAQCLLDTSMRMHAAAINVAARDCAAGSKFLKNNFDERILVSSNLCDAITGQPLFNPFLVTTLSSLRIGILGLTGPEGTPGDHGILVADPLPSGRRAAEALQRKGCDIVILLSQLTGEQNRLLTSEVPGIHFVIGSSDGTPEDRPLPCGNAHIISPGQHGTHAAVIVCTVEDPSAALTFAEETLSEGTDTARPMDKTQHSGNSFTYRLAALDDTVPADPGIEVLLESFRQERLRRELRTDGLRYLDAVPAVDMDGLDQAGRSRAIRLMNTISCADNSIAQCASDAGLCRDMAVQVVTGVREGLSDGAVQFKVMREIQARRSKPDIPLDKPALR